MIATRIICHVVSCNWRDKKESVCTHTSIHLQGCSPDADNVVVCSEFWEGENEAQA